MNRVFVDEETGEDLIHPFYECDACRSIDLATTVNDAETGEPEVIHMDHSMIRTRHRRVPFQVYSGKYIASFSNSRITLRFSRPTLNNSGI